MVVPSVKQLYMTLRRKFNNIKLRNKLIISFIVVVFLPVTFVGVFLTNELRQIALKDAMKQTEKAMERIRRTPSRS